MIMIVKIMKIMRMMIRNPLLSLTFIKQIICDSYHDRKDETVGVIIIKSINHGTKSDRMI